MNDAQQKKGRRTLLLITFIFATPIVAAMFLYFSGSSFSPGRSTEHGVLVSPPIELADEQLIPDNPEARFRKIWSLVVLADENCDAACVISLEYIRQIRLSLGPKMTRMQTVFLPAADSAIGANFPTEHPKLIVVDPASAAGYRDAVGSYESGEIFLVDPLGNLMMRYPPGTGMGDIRKDVAHLFKLSGIG